MSRRKVGIAILVVATWLGARAPARSTPFLTGRVFDSADGVDIAAASWHAWCLGNPVYLGPLLPSEARLGTLRADGFFGEVESGYCGEWVVAVELEVPDALGPAGRSGYFASTRDVPCAGTSNMPASKLVALPAPSAATHGRDATIEWSLPTTWGLPLDATRGLAGWAIHRSPASVDAFVEVGRVLDPLSTEWTDVGAPDGDWEYALKAVFVGPVDGAHLSRKTAVVTTPTSELRIVDSVAWLGPAGPTPACGLRTIPPLASFMLTPCGAPGPDCSPDFVLPPRRALTLRATAGTPDLVLRGEALADAEPGVLTFYELDGCSLELLVGRAGADLVLDTR